MKKLFLVALFFLSVLSTTKAQFIELPPSGGFDLILVFDNTVSAANIERLRVDLNAVDLGVTTPITRARVWRKRGPIGPTGVPSASYSISEASNAVDRVRGGTTSVGNGALVQINATTQIPEGSFKLEKTSGTGVAYACKIPTDYQLSATDIGSSTVKVAILDSGLECNSNSTVFAHPYLRSFVEVASSRSFSVNSWVNDKHGHGTAVASIIIRSFVGTSRAANCKIIPIKVLDNDGRGNLFNLIRGIDHAIQSGADIINISIVSPDESGYGKVTPIQLALKKAAEQNILVVTAAGNDGKDISQQENTIFPACAVSDNQIVIGASKCGDDRAEFSNYGKNVDVFSPGIQIPVSQLTWQEGGIFREGDGSSFAAPIVAGMAAVLRTQQTSRNYQTLKCAILNGSARVSAFTDYCKTGAVINAPGIRSKFPYCPR